MEITDDLRNSQTWCIVWYCRWVNKTIKCDFIWDNQQSRAVLFQVPGAELFEAFPLVQSDIYFQAILLKNSLEN